MQPYVKHLFRHFKIGDIPKTIGVPTEPWVHTAGYIDVGVAHKPIFFFVSDTGLDIDQRPNGLESGIPYKIMNVVGKA